MGPIAIVLYSVATFSISSSILAQGKPKRWKRPLHSPIGVSTDRCVLGKKTAPKAGTDAFPGGNGHAKARTEWAINQCEISDPKVRKLFTHYFDHEKNLLVRLPVDQLGYPSFAEDDRGTIDPQKKKLQGLGTRL